MYTDAVVGLVANYNELNSARIQELDEEPSALEFMRFVSRNMPFVVRRAAEDWRASRKWSAQYLRDILGTQHVKVAVTPNGYMSMMSIQAPSSTARLERHKTDTDSPETPLSLADAPTQLENELLVFAKPFEEDQPFRDFLDHIIKQEKRPDQEVGDEVRYAQTRKLRHFIRITVGSHSLNYLC
jgi:jumonji domain-containing protein 7